MTYELVTHPIRGHPSHDWDMKAFPVKCKVCGVMTDYVISGYTCEEVLEDNLLKEFTDEHGDDFYFLQKLKAKNFSEKQIAAIVNILLDSCSHCYGESPCQCWNDE